MRFLALALLAATGAVAQPALTLPSGSNVTPYDLIVEEGVIRLRFISAGLAQDEVGYRSDPLMLLQDMTYLCNLQVTADPPANDTEVVVTLMDQPLEFGVVDPSVTQYFEAFLIRDQECALADAEFLD